jgi:hypothetical protein
MESLALIINLVLFSLYTVILIAVSISEAKEENKDKEELKKAA